MIFIPLPFVVALFLATVLLRMFRRGEGGFAENRLFALLIAAYALQSVLIGLRWGYGYTDLRVVQAVLAVLIASLAWLAFRGLAGDGAPPGRLEVGLNLLPPAAIAVLIVVAPQTIGPLIILDFLAYGAALVWLARLGPDGLVAARLDGTVRSYRSLQVTAFALIGSGLTDVAINLDFMWSDGRHSAAVVAFGNVVALLLLGAAASVAGDGTAAERTEEAEAAETPTAREQSPSDRDAEIAAAVDALMAERRLYTDVELNLGKLARRLHLPARSVSQAINRIHAMSVSQYVNNLRVAESCRLLSDTDEPVTRIVYDAGFLTKSNFNREFLRVTGRSPTAWRQAHAPLAAAG